MTRNAFNCQSAPFKAGVNPRIVAPQTNGQASKGPATATTKTVPFRVQVSKGNVTVTRAQKS